MLPRLISLEQGVFIGEHSISNNILIIHEFMHDLQQVLGCYSLVAIKLDME